MCTVCDARMKDETTVAVLVEAIKKNGKCSSHDEITKGMATATARINLMLLFQCAIAMLLVIHLGWK